MEQQHFDYIRAVLENFFAAKFSVTAVENTIGKKEVEKGEKVKISA